MRSGSHDGFERRLLRAVAAHAVLQLGCKIRFRHFDLMCLIVCAKAFEFVCTDVRMAWISSRDFTIRIFSTKPAVGRSLAQTFSFSFSSEYAPKVKRLRSIAMRFHFFRLMTFDTASKSEPRLILTAQSDSVGSWMVYLGSVKRIACSFVISRSALLPVNPQRYRTLGKARHDERIRLCTRSARELRVSSATRCFMP